MSTSIKFQILLGAARRSSTKVLMAATRSGTFSRHLTRFLRAREQGDEAEAQEKQEEDEEEEDEEEEQAVAA